MNRRIAMQIMAVSAVIPSVRIPVAEAVECKGFLVLSTGQEVRLEFDNLEKKKDTVCYHFKEYFARNDIEIVGYKLFVRDKLVQSGNLYPDGAPFLRIAGDSLLLHITV
jgi:hypothetical protein